MCEVAEKYDPTYGVLFRTYLGSRLIGAFRDLMRVDVFKCEKCGGAKHPVTRRCYKCHPTNPQKIAEREVPEAKPDAPAQAESGVPYETCGRPKSKANNRCYHCKPTRLRTDDRPAEPPPLTALQRRVRGIRDERPVRVESDEPEVPEAIEEETTITATEAASAPSADSGHATVAAYEHALAREPAVQPVPFAYAQVNQATLSQGSPAQVELMTQLAIVGLLDGLEPAARQRTLALVEAHYRSKPA